MFKTLIWVVGIYITAIVKSILKNKKNREFFF